MLGRGVRWLVTFVAGVAVAGALVSPAAAETPASGASTDPGVTGPRPTMPVGPPRAAADDPTDGPTVDSTGDTTVEASVAANGAAATPVVGQASGSSGALTAPTSPIPAVLPATAPEVTIVPAGDASYREGDDLCGTIGFSQVTRGLLTVRRTGATDAPLTVGYSVAGTATPGIDYVALPGSVAIPAGAAAATIDVEPRRPPAFASFSRTGSLEVVLAAGSGADAYVVGEPRSAMIAVVRESTRSGCPSPVFPSDTGWQHQTIHVGERPASIPIDYGGPGLTFAISSGSLPAGLVLSRDGSFAGAADTAGSFEARVSACTPPDVVTGDDGTRVSAISCAGTAITLTVIDDPQVEAVTLTGAGRPPVTTPPTAATTATTASGTLALTGPGSPAPRLVDLGAVLVAVGVVARVLAGRGPRRALRT